MLGAGTGVRYRFARAADHLQAPGRLLVRDRLSDDIRDGLPHPTPKAANHKGGKEDERGTERGVGLDADRVEPGPPRKVGRKFATSHSAPSRWFPTTSAMSHTSAYSLTLSGAVIVSTCHPPRARTARRR